MPKKPLPQFVAPMQASSVKKPLEPKIRFLNHSNGLRSRSSHDDADPVKRPTIRNSVNDLDSEQ